LSRAWFSFSQAKLKTSAKSSSDGGSFFGQRNRYWHAGSPPAWVALWRPGELSLLRWYPFKRDAKLLGKLEQTEKQVIEKAKEQVDERRDYQAKSDNRLSTADWRSAGCARHGCTARLERRGGASAARKNMARTSWRRKSYSRWRKLRLSVLTLSPERVGISEGAMTVHGISRSQPIWVIAESVLNRTVSGIEERGAQLGEHKKVGA
jgi:hypothetical protein